MCTNFEIASVVFKICIVHEPTTTPGPLLLLARQARDTVTWVCLEGGIP